VRRRNNRFWLKTSALVVAVVSRTYVVYVLFGAIARLFGRVESIHMTYPAESRFREAYTFQAPFLRRLYRAFDWTPSPIALFWQGGKLGLTLAVPSDEAALVARENEAKLRLLLRRLRLIQRLVGASQVTLAGILPSLIARNRIDTGGLVVADPRPATRRALLSAIDQVVESDFDGKRPPILLFGGAGYVGADLKAALEANGDALCIIDVKEGAESAETCLSRFRGQPVLLVDVARRGALAPQISRLWPELVLLNETYPEPTGKMLAALHSRGIRVRHVAGVAGTLRPSLPGAYAGAVPCCAAHRIGETTKAVVIAL